MKKNVELQKDVTIGTFINLQSLGWRGHLERKDGARNIKKKYQANLYEKDLRVDPKLGGKIMCRRT